jgi:hypothetical protein
MRLLLPALLLVSAAVAAPLHAAEPASTDQGRQKAMQLLDVSTPMTEMKEQFVSNFVTSFNKGLDGDPRLAQLEARKPGLGKAVKGAVAAELDRQAPIELAVVRNKLSTIFQQTLTMEDMDAAIAYFSSPAGVRMRDRMKAGGQARIDEMRNAGEFKNTSTSAAIGKATDSAIVSGMQDMTAEDSAALFKFSQTPASKKMEDFRPHFMAMLSSEMDAMANRLMTKITPVIARAISQHMSRK